MNRLASARKATPTPALSAILLASLAACGGGSSSSEQTAQADAAPSAVAASAPLVPTDSLLDTSTAAALATTEAIPAYHMAPALLDEPSQIDVGGTSASARTGATNFNVDASVAGMDTARLSRDTLKQRLADGKARVASATGDTAAPMATAIVGAVHTPAQIRAAYGLATLPIAGAALTTAQAAALGAGQTIYLVDAFHDATALSDLNAFSTRFGLPT